MSKKETMQSMWIEVTVRLPNPEVHPHILTYNSHSKLINHPFSFVICEIVGYMQKFLNGEVKRPKDCISALEITHWMPIHTPDGIEAYVEPKLPRHLRNPISKRRS